MLLLPMGDEILCLRPNWWPLGELPRRLQQMGLCGSAGKSPAPDASPLVCLNNQLQGKSLWVIKLAALQDWGLLMPGVVGFSAASLFIPFLKQLHQISVFTLAGCWRRPPLCWGVRGTGSVTSGCAELVTLFQRCQACFGWMLSSEPLTLCLAVEWGAQGMAAPGAGRSGTAWSPPAPVGPG